METVNLGYFLVRLQDAVSSLPDLKSTIIKIESMRDAKKGEHWATSVLRYLDDGQQHYRQEGTIYINLRDCQDEDKIIRAVAHEASHLAQDRIPEDSIYYFLLGYLKNCV